MISTLLDIVVPEIVMLLAPVLVDVACLHALQRSLHADGANVDVPDGHGHEEDRRHAVADVGQLHVSPGEVVHARDDRVQHPSGGRHHQAENRHAKPEPELLATVETMARALPTAHKPFEVLGRGDVVLHVEHKEDHHADGEDRSNDVVHVLQEPSQRAIGVPTQDGQQEVLAPEQNDAGHSQYDESDGHGPVGIALHCREPQDHLPGGTVMQANRAFQDVHQPDGRQRNGEDPSTKHSDDAVAEEPPVIAARLNQNTSLGRLDRAVMLDITVDLSPDRTVVGRLG